MKQSILKRVMMAAVALCMIPAALMAQEDKTKDKEKDKEKVKKQVITITRDGDDNQKTVIEIDGDKVKINGKDAADLKNVHVNVHNLKGSGVIGFGQGTPNAYSFNFNYDNPSIFKVDSNRAMLGVTTENNEKGARIQKITKESAAEKIGLKQGDVITKIDNRKIEDASDVTDAVRAHKPGDKISITYLRDGKEQKATTELGRWKGVDITSMTTPNVLNDQVWRERLNDRTFERVPGFQGNTFTMTTNRPKLGMSVQDTDDGKGVKVLDVDDDGTAYKAGIKEGDIITKIDDKDVNSADEIAKLVREKKDQPSLRLQIKRGGRTENVEVKFPKKIKTVDL